jgi:signal transduction histidine kinase
VVADGTVILLSAPLEDPLSSVDVLQRRFLLAALIGLAFAVVVGYAAATMHASRIRRLERAAERIAGGRFDEPVVDGGTDELGQLATAFERMRVRLEKLDRARSEFIANASHELRTPLFSLAGFLELMDDEELDERTRREFLETMREQVDRLAKLATDLLDLSRLDAGRIHVEHEPVDLGEVARTVAEEFRVVADQRSHPVSVTVEGSAIARADELRTLQVARAQLDNALVHTPPGTPIVLRARIDREHAYLEVEDAGPGIPPEHAPHVFDRFYRAGGGLASGSGLGLAIARELVSVMGGRVELESEPGRTVVRVVLGAAPTSQPAPVEADTVFT